MNKVTIDIISGTIKLLSELSLVTLLQCPHLGSGVAEEGEEGEEEVVLLVDRGGDGKGREEVRKFLNFYKRKNSVCVDLYQPAFYNRKPNWEDLADFVYSVLAVGGTSSPQQVRAAVVDIQLHPVKKLLFLKFADQAVRDEVATRLQEGLVWPAFATTVTGWGMDKSVERIRVLGVSPETNEGGVRTVLEQYGEILEARKGYISRKLPGVTNGIWTVKLVLGKEKVLPPFLIMKEEGEVWQLATGEASVCWKCGQSGHIGDKCHQDVSTLAASLSGPTESQQPSWAHVVRGARAVHQYPVPPVPPCLPSVGALDKPVTEEGLRVSKARLRSGVDRVVDKAVDKVENEIVEMLMKEIIGMCVDETIEKYVDEAVEEAVDRVVEETLVYLVNEAVSKSVEKEVDLIPLGAAVEDLAHGPGAKHIRFESGSAVPSNDSSSVSPPRARKVAAAKPESGPEKGSISFEQNVGEEGRYIKYKSFDIVLDDGTEHGGG